MFRRNAIHRVHGFGLAALILVVATGATLPRNVSAQEADLSLIEQVSSAFAQTASMSSLTLESRSVTEAEGLPAGFDLSQQSLRTALLIRSGETWDISSSDTSITGTPQGEMRITSETITVNGVTYIRFTELPDTIETGFPVVWTDTATLVTEEPATLSETNNADNILGELALPVTAESVSAASLLADDAIDGQTMRVIQLTLDPASVLESGAAALLQSNTGPGLGMMGGAGGFGADGQMPTLPEGISLPEGAAPPDAATFDESPALEPEDVQITLAVYIGADDGLVHRIYRVIALAPTEGGMPFAFTTTTLTNYSDHGAPASIVPPALGM